MLRSYLVIASCFVLYSTATPDHVLPSAKRPQILTHDATEILYIEDGYPERTYRFEDFFWTGSGDGESENTDYPWLEPNSPATIYKTKTIMSTVYVSSSNNESDTETGTKRDCVINCETETVPEGDISPTPTLDKHTTPPPHFNATNSTADRQFWLLTVIRNNGHDPVIAVLEKRLAKLYSVAFRRQQERHLGINNRHKRAAIKQYPAENKPVNVYIHNLERNPENNQIEVLYHVLVSGKPVEAVTAASDMRLVSDEEVAKELGFAILTKAEPYIKVERPQGLSRTRDTWLFIGVATTAIILLLIIVTVFTLCLNKKKKNASMPGRSGVANRQHIFEREVGSSTGYIEGQGDVKVYQSGKRNRKQGIENASTETLASRFPDGRPASSSSSTTSSCSSVDISPMITPKHKPFYSRKKHRHFTKKPTLNRVVLHQQSPVEADLDSSSDRQGSEKVLIKDKDERRMSPKSYLSMPSVKSFPRSSIPEPLSKVLEPVSVLHLDVTDEAIPEPSPVYRSNKMTRHGSMGYEDPGVVGPVVWNLHNKRMQMVSDAEDENEARKPSHHTNRMRKRFNELLDDTFTLFGSSRETQVEPSELSTSNTPQPTRPPENRGQSAIVKAAETSNVPKPRPKTCGQRRITPSPGVEPPRGAWASGTPSPLVRPLSAGPFHRPATKPAVEVERIMADGTLLPTDPAVPLIAAIKTELQKCSLPGSTTNLVE